MNRQQFYKSKKWYQVSSGYRKHVHNICERCGIPTWRKNDKNYIKLKEEGQDVRFGIVHHREYLNESNFTDAWLAYAWENLELLCVECHNKEHMSKGDEVREDVKFDEEGRLIRSGKKEIHYGI